MEDLRVLELNADFIPLNLVPLSTITWKEAFKKIYEGTAVPIKYYKGKRVRTPNQEFPVPSVIVLKEFKHLKKNAKWSKFNIKLRDEFKCQYCAKTHSVKSLTIDHVHPKSKGGKHSWTNSVAACKKCNQVHKGNRTDMKPIRKPYQPSYYELAKKMLKYKQVHHKDWLDYIQHLG
jgi:5-methylcytosine-specific restriction endonuclease McrA